MGQKCGVPPVVPCKQPNLGTCVCRHGQATLKGGIDEQEDIVHTFLESEPTKLQMEEATLTTVQVKHVQDMLVPEGGVFTGQARENGQPHGKGMQRWSDGTVYSGAWHSGAAHGSGKLTKSDGSGYDGMWVEGRKHGLGYERLVDESEYRGEFVDGQKHGSGAFRWKGGASYTGEFVEDALQGEGVFLWGDGRSYRGQWVQSRMHGQGKFEWQDGKSFEGKYENDKKHGPGIFSWPDSSKCVGIWYNGKQHGVGTHVNANGFARKGKWNAGNLQTWLDPPQPSSKGDDYVEPAEGAMNLNADAPALSSKAAAKDSSSNGASKVVNQL